MNTIVPFDFGHHAVRTLIRNGEPWFVLVDVCRVLEIGNPSDAARRLDDDEKNTVSIIEGGNIKGLGTVGAMPTIINESGLFSLIFTSRKEAARRFEKWVTGTVLPSLRKHGGYVVGQESLTTTELFARATAVANAVIAEHEAKRALREPAATRA